MIGNGIHRREFHARSTVRLTVLLQSGATPTPSSTPIEGGAPESVVAGLAFLGTEVTLVLAVGAALVGSLLAVGVAYAVELPDRRLALLLPAASTVAVDIVLAGWLGVNPFAPGFEPSTLSPLVVIQTPAVAFAGLALWLRADTG